MQGGGMQGGGMQGGGMQGGVQTLDQPAAQGYENFGQPSQGFGQFGGGMGGGFNPFGGGMGSGFNPYGGGFGGFNQGFNPYGGGMGLGGSNQGSNPNGQNQSPVETGEFKNLLQPTQAQQMPAQQPMQQPSNALVPASQATNPMMAPPQAQSSDQPNPDAALMASASHGFQQDVGKMRQQQMQFAPRGFGQFGGFNPYGASVQHSMQQPFQGGNQFAGHSMQQPFQGGNQFAGLGSLLQGLRGFR
jgi:hypothetical protein